MRAQLKNITESDYWVYGISEADFDYVIDFIREIVGARAEQYEILATKVRAESPDVADEILDDIAYYRYTNEQHLWQFALWRQQGLIEGVIAHQLIGVGDSKKLLGLRAKLEALQSKGYTVKAAEIEELSLWAKLRNALSHAPPEKYSPAPLREEDIMEYTAFVKELYNRWQEEKKNIIKS